MNAHQPPSVELVFFSGCPHVELARAALREALMSTGLPLQWTEWDQHENGVPDRVRGYGSPTILVAGCDVTGASRSAAGSACRADGVPSPGVISAALARKFSERQETPNDGRMMRVPRKAV